MNVALLPSAIATFRQQHPQVEFKLQELAAEALLAAVEEGRADFGMCAKPAPDQRLRYQPLQPATFRSVGIVTRIGRTLAPASLAFMRTLVQQRP